MRERHAATVFSPLITTVFHICQNIEINDKVLGRIDTDVLYLIWKERSRAEFIAIIWSFYK